MKHIISLFNKIFPQGNSSHQKPNNSQSRIHYLKLFFLISIITTFSFINLQKLLADNLNSLQITEIGNHEISNLQWIEIYNPTSENFALTGLIFREDNINHKTTLMQGTNILSPQEYALIVNRYDLFIEKYPEFSGENYIILDSSWKNLDNNGESLELIMNTEIIESLTYTSNFGNTSLQRIFNGENYINQWIPHPTDHGMFKETDTSQEEEPDFPEEDFSEEYFPEEEFPNESFFDENNDGEETLNESEEILTENNNTEIPNNEDNQVLVPQEIKIISPYILISEVSFNSTPDWIEIFVDPRGTKIQENSLQIEIDKKFTTIEHSEIEIPTVLTVDLNLVATTEQVSILYEDQVFDSICWTNGNPPQNEIEEEQILKDNNYWQGDCLDSTLIKKDQTFSRYQLLPDTNTKEDFTINPFPIKGEINNYINQSPTAEISLKSGKLNGETPLKFTLSGTKSTDPENDILTYTWKFNDTIVSTQANPDTFTISDSGTHKIQLTVTDSSFNSSSSTIFAVATEKAGKVENPDSNSKTATSTSTSTTSSNSAIATTPIANIQLTKFLPNPKGADTETEWIEITNFDTQKVDLENYYLDDEEGGSKPFHLQGKTISPNQTLRIQITESKISLGNTKDSVRLLHYDNVVEEIAYEQAKDDEIFEKINGEWVRYIEGATSPSSAQTPSSPTPQTKTTSLPATSTTATKSGTSQSPLPLQGTENNQILISEIFPNPKGTDTGKEWIELHNQSQLDTPLDNWTLKLNNKLYKLDNLFIKGNQYLLIKDEKLSIPNSNSTIQLLDHKQNIIDQFTYEKSFEDQSIIKILNQFYWTKILTPEAPNPQLIELQGTIQEVDPVKQQLLLLDSSENQHLINFTTNTKFTPTWNLRVQAWLHQDQYILHEIINLAPPSKSTSPTSSSAILWTLLLPLAGLPTYFFREQLKELLSNLSN